MNGDFLNRLYILERLDSDQDTPLMIAASNRIDKLTVLAPITRWIINSDPARPFVKRVSNELSPFPSYTVREVPYVC